MVFRDGSPSWLTQSLEVKYLGSLHANNTQGEEDVNQYIQS